jgi:hypothetical protein
MRGHLSQIDGFQLQPHGCEVKLESPALLKNVQAEIPDKRSDSPIHQNALGTQDCMESPNFECNFAKSHRLVRLRSAEPADLGCALLARFQNRWKLHGESTKEIGALSSGVHRAKRGVPPAGR